MSASKDQARKKAAELEGKLKTKRFLAGDLPGPEDAKAFEELLGDNMHVVRWAKHIASFTPAQRAGFAAVATSGPVSMGGGQAPAASPKGGKAASPKGGKAPAKPLDVMADKPNEKRNLLLDLQNKAQARWEAEKVFEVDPPAEGEEDTGKFMATFPYPYMNGKLHLGHAFSLLKAEFAVSYNRLLGKRSLYPFGFHCTGMPIQAAANKLRNDYKKYGSPYPKFPSGRPQVVLSKGVSETSVKLMWGPPTSTGHQDVVDYTLEFRTIGADGWKQVEGGRIPHVLEELEVDSHGNKKPKVTKLVEGLPSKTKFEFRVTAHLADGTSCPTSAVSEEVETTEAVAETKGKDKKKKGPAKIAQKSGDALHQWDIMRGMGIAEDDIPAFTDPMKWLDYFPPEGREDVKKLGIHVDFRRSFITTSINPYYDAFIRWQFNRLKAGNRLAFGKRPTVYSEVDQQACMDHDRSEGEGVGFTEYTSLKLEVVEPLPEVLKGITDKPIYILAATLRPETMIGQTNAWALPGGQYGVFACGEKEVYLCTDRAARNMSFQDTFPEWGKVKKIKDVMGSDLMGATLKGPKCPYPTMHLLPLTTIKMDKGTGFVTSVPADSPDDYAALMDLMNPKKREFYGVKEEWVAPFQPVPLIDVVIDGENRTMCAEYLCKKLGVQSQKDVDKLRECKEIAYKLAFYEGTMSAGDYKGEPVMEAKAKCRQHLLDTDAAFVYYEPESMIRSRSGDECVIALIDQWYLKYGDEPWKNAVGEHLKDTLDCYSPATHKAFTEVLDWLKEWACSRSFGLGTQIPWDKQFVIESLSDSTIYMAYYSLAKFFHGHNNLKGDRTGPGGIKAEDVDDHVFDYVFLKKDYNPECKVPEEKLKPMRKEFEFWYPMDLRVSGKDLIQNHLTMSLYNHAAIWENQPEMWPRSFYTNGWVLVDGEKMSKSKGNFLTLQDSIGTFSADATRLACAHAGDSLDDANFEIPTANKAILKLHALYEYAQKFKKEKGDYRTQKDLFIDSWFENEMSRLMVEAKQHFERMRFKEALRCAWFDFHTCRDTYFDVLGSKKPHAGLVEQWLQWISIMMSIITPHTCEAVWGILDMPGTVLNSRFPEATVDHQVTEQGKYLFDKVKADFIEKFEKAKKKGPKMANVYIAVRYPAWKLQVIDMLKKNMSASGAFTKDVMKEFDLKSLPEDSILRPKGKQVGQFAGMVKAQADKEISEMAGRGIQVTADKVTAFDLELPFEEMKLLKEHSDYLLSKVKLDKLTFYFADAADVPDVNTAENAVPGKPSMAFC